MSSQVSIFFRPYQIPAGADLTECIGVARAMDEAGLHSIIFGDHLLLGNNPEKYPYGQFQHPSGSAWLEPLTTLAAMAAVTKNLKLATGILLAPLRAPTLLAKTIASLDVLSKGRTQLALGVGWQAEEYEAVGIPWDERYKRLDEGVRVCRALWGEQPVTFESAHVKLDNAWALPRPVQSRVPLLYGLAMTPRNAQRMAELGDGWCPVVPTLDQIRDGVAMLSDALNAVGRDIASQHIRLGVPHLHDASGKIDVQKSLAVIPDLKAAGGTIFTIASPPKPESMAEIYRFVEDVAKHARELGC